MYLWAWLVVQVSVKARRNLAGSTFEYSLVEREVALDSFETVICSNTLIVEESVNSLGHSA